MCSMRWVSQLIKLSVAGCDEVSAEALRHSLVKWLSLTEKEKNSQASTP
jgi:hypothetical protein